VDDDVAEINQDPLPLGAPLDPERLDPVGLLDPLLHVVGESLHIGDRAARGDDEHVGEEEGVGNVEQDNVGSVLGEQGVSRRAGQVDTVLYDVIPIFMKGPTISSQAGSA